MTEITPFPENNYETVLLDRPFGGVFFCPVFTLVLLRFCRYCDIMAPYFV